MRRPLLFSSTLALALPIAAKADDWQSLFNGKDLHWLEGQGGPVVPLKTGAITGYTKDGKIPGGNSFLVWEGNLSDFELKVQLKIVGGNSGIQYRIRNSSISPTTSTSGGYQADMDGSKAQGFFGILYEERRPRRPHRPSGARTSVAADGAQQAIGLGSRPTTQSN